MSKDTNKTCFIICPIGDEKTSIRKRANDLLEFIITPCLDEYNYKPIRADHITKPGMITNQIIRNVIDSDLVIADLFDFNPNVLYELAIRHVTRKPYIQLMEKGKRLPFDIGDVRTIFFDIGDIRSVDFVIKELKKQIKSIIEENLTEVESPISRVQDIKELLESKDPQKQNTAVILEQMGAIQSTVNEMRRELDIKKTWDNSLIPRYIYPQSSQVDLAFNELGELYPDSTKVLRNYLLHGKKESSDTTHRLREWLKALEKKEEDKDSTS